jgi:hypothetical protein
MKKQSLITVSVVMLGVAQMLLVTISSSSQDSSQSNRAKVVEGTWHGTLEADGMFLN